MKDNSLLVICHNTSLLKKACEYAMASAAFGVQTHFVFQGESIDGQWQQELSEFDVGLELNPSDSELNAQIDLHKVIQVY